MSQLSSFQRCSLCSACQFSGGHRNLDELQIAVIRLEVCVSWLCLGHCLKVNCSRGGVQLYSIGFYARQGVGNRVSPSSDVTDVSGELRDEV